MSWEPATQSMEMTSFIPGSTAVANSVEREDPHLAGAHVADGRDTGRLPAASAAAIGIGEKLFCAVIA